jgi:CubicO group peptidase (beta-lactamase class C family)
MKSNPYNQFPKSFRLFSSAFFLIASTVIFSASGVFASTSRGQKPHMLNDKPVEEVIADLQDFIPAYMREQSIPGVAIALVRDGEIVWTGGYGVMNTLTRQPVRSDTLFDIASNNKVVTAYIALRLADQGLLSLDEPLNSYLEESWLPPSEYRDAVTLRRVLSHTSGLGHLTLSRDLLFEPGRGYSYSAIGFLYTQAVIEHITGKPFEQLAQELVFEPLGMSSSSFVNRSDLVPRTSNGHMRAAIPVSLFLIPFLVCGFLIGLVGLIIQRIRTNRLQLTRKAGIVILTIAYLITGLLIFVFLSQLGFPEYAWLVLISGFAFVVTILAASWAGRAILTRIIPGSKGLLSFLTVLWVIIVMVGSGYIVLSMGNLPVSKNAAVEIGSAGVMHSTAEDLAKFLIEIADPQYLSAELAGEMHTPQVWLQDDLAWGLGPGIQYNQGDYVLWQWGQTIDFQSVMMINPQSGSGVVVFTNSDLLNPDVAVKLAHRALGGKIEPIRRATHLEFDYDGPTLEE